MPRTSWQQYMRQENERARARIYDLEQKLRVAVDRLVTISNGMHHSNEVQDTWSRESKLQVTASKGLEKLARMQERLL